MNIQTAVTDLLTHMGVAPALYTNGDLAVTSPVDGKIVAQVHTTPTAEVDTLVAQSTTAFQAWRQVPAPRRGELVRLLGNKLRDHKQHLGELVSLESGKLLQEGLGEVQEMIDICDFAVGLSRQLYGLTIASERPQHKMQENWHPLGPVLVISAFNFPVAVWSWNTSLAIVCGNPVIWKPSEKTPLTALACQAIMDMAIEDFGDAPAHLSQVLIGDASHAGLVVDDPRVPLVSATGSCAMGQAVAPRVAARMGRSILELGGNNAIIVCPTADLDMAVRAIVFGAVGTAGQRCTSTRRLFVHASLHAELEQRLTAAYRSVTVGNPLEEGNLVGPLIDQRSFEHMQAALKVVAAKGATITGGERQAISDLPEAYYVRPALVVMPASETNVFEETFAPILYMFSYDNLDEAIAANNAVPQGLSSAIFTNNVREAETFTSATGSDCGITNVNIGTSGAEVGGAFGGEKATGGGRESGSDAWKGYMRRSTNTINYSADLPLAQGIKFDI
jgi:aldehyde dehydrogenase (NAD+)